MEPNKILEFWFDELKPEDWFTGGEEVDDRIRARFLKVWEEAVDGKFASWAVTADGALALVIVFDQFPRNMFRGSGKSFASDALALKTAAEAIDAGQDMELNEVRRRFLYMPYMHSEKIPELTRCVELMETKFAEANPEVVLHAKAHIEVVRLFGRFPYRNEALGRNSTPEEKEWLAAGGYQAFVDSMRK